jgi:hypothetical protein
MKIPTYLEEIFVMVSREVEGWPEQRRSIDPYDAGDSTHVNVVGPVTQTTDGEPGLRQRAISASA